MFVVYFSRIIHSFIASSSSSAPRTNSNGALNSKFLMKMVGIHLDACRSARTQFSYFSITKVAVLIRIRLWILGSPAVVKPARVLVAAGILFELLAALIICLCTLLSAGQQNAGPQRLPTALVIIGITTLIVAILWQTIHMFAAQDPGQGGTC
jgi:hypothetical protein